MSKVREQLEEILCSRILLLDGSMGAFIQKFGPTEADYRGERFADHSVDLKNSTDVLCLTQPEMINSIHRQYLEAGSDIIETNTFNANLVSMEEFELGDYVHEINCAAPSWPRSWLRSTRQRPPTSRGSSRAASAPPRFSSDSTPTRPANGRFVFSRWSIPTRPRSAG